MHQYIEEHWGNHEQMRWRGFGVITIPKLVLWGLEPLSRVLHCETGYRELRYRVITTIPPLMLTNPQSVDIRLSHSNKI